MPWGRALAVVGVIGAAHLALFLLLTMSARTDIREIEERYDEKQLAAARDPGGRPRNADPAAGREWLGRQRLWEASLKLDQRGQYVSLLGFGLLGSFLVQTGVTGVLLYRSANRRTRSRGRGIRTA